MDLENIKKLAEVDMKIDTVDLDKESLAVPQLHNKYLNFYSDARLSYKKLKTKYSILKKKKWEYYTGKMSKEELTELKWNPLSLKIIRQDVDIYLESDPDLMAINAQMILEEEKIEYLESILKSIMNRHWSIRSAIEWRKFTNGVT